MPTVGLYIFTLCTCLHIFSLLWSWTWSLHTPCVLILYVISCIVASIWNVFLVWNVARLPLPEPLWKPFQISFQDVIRWYVVTYKIVYISSHQTPYIKQWMMVTPRSENIFSSFIITRHVFWRPRSYLELISLP